MKHAAALCAVIALASGSLFASAEGQWLDLQLQQMELESKYREQHPKMQDFKCELAAVHQQLGEPDFAAYVVRANERMLELRLTVLDLSQKYREQHPKVELLHRQIAFLETIPGAHLDPTAMTEALRRLNVEKAVLEGRYRDQHPALLTQQAKIEFLESELAKQSVQL